MLKSSKPNPQTSFFFTLGESLNQRHPLYKRTLARYSQKKLVAFYKIDGKIWYKASEVQEFLKKKGKGIPK